ncbi:MAG: Holliday junction branch migration protein RuvA [Marivivens sp.]|nr:Holliday junction branch migration protein RuvA [Marivivens sp.]
MIGRLSGIVAYKSHDHVMIDVRGVGYIVYVSERTRAALPREGEAVTIYTDLLVREDLMQLFGFSTLVEKEWHRLLTGVQGIGAKASLSILGALGADGVSRAIALGDWNSVAKAKGVGPKTAQRVTMELKDKAPSVMSMAEVVGTEREVVIEDERDVEVRATPPKPVQAARSSAQAEALSALQNLGYAPGEAASAVAEALDNDAIASTSALIRSALRLLAPKG